MKRTLKLIVIMIGVSVAFWGLKFLRPSSNDSMNPATAKEFDLPVRKVTNGPLRVDPQNPRYFEDASGKAVYLTGSHTWNNVQDISNSRELNYREYLQFLVRVNHNFTRLWAIENAAWEPSSTNMVVIHPLPYRRTGPGTALDGGPKFNLDEFDPAYFDRLRSRVIAARDCGIYVSVMLFNGWSIGKKPWVPGNPWPGHPFNRENNVNGIAGDLNQDGEGAETHTLASPTITALQDRYVRKVVDTLNDLDNVLWEISNESAGDAKEWQYHMIRLIKNYEATKPMQHPVGMTSSDPEHDNPGLFASPADWISPAFTATEDYRDNPPPTDGKKVVLLDTDHLWGVGGNSAWVWKSFTRGYNPIFMDPFETNKWDSVRSAMGTTLACADMVDLSGMLPRPDLASSHYCLANPDVAYVVYLPILESPFETARFFHRFKKQIRQFQASRSYSVSVDLTQASGSFAVSWLDPLRRYITLGDVVKGGSRITFTAPFKGDAVLILQNKNGSTNTAQ